MSFPKNRASSAPHLSQGMRNRGRPRELGANGTSNEGFYLGCDIPDEVDSFELEFAYDLHTFAAADIPSLIARLDEQIEYYVIEGLDIGDCATPGLWMVDKAPTDHGNEFASLCSSTISSVDGSVVSTICTPISGALTVRYDHNIVSKAELENKILNVIRYGMEHNKLLSQSIIPAVRFVESDRISATHGVGGGGDIPAIVGIAVAGVVCAACLLVYVMKRRRCDATEQAKGKPERKRSANQQNKQVVIVEEEEEMEVFALV